MIKKHQDLNLETKIVKNSAKYAFVKAENRKFYESNFEPLLNTFSIGLFSFIFVLISPPKFLNLEKR